MTGQVSDLGSVGVIPKKLVMQYAKVKKFHCNARKNTFCSCLNCNVIKTLSVRDVEINLFYCHLQFSRSESYVNKCSL